MADAMCTIRLRGCKQQSSPQTLQTDKALRISYSSFNFFSGFASLKETALHCHATERALATLFLNCFSLAHVCMTPTETRTECS